MTFGGGETYLLYIQGFPLREFASFEVIDDEPAWQRMEDELLRPIADAAAARGFGLLADGFVWRASSDYVARLGAPTSPPSTSARSDTSATSSPAGGRRDAVAACPMVVTGDIGPRGDGYAASGTVSSAPRTTTTHPRSRRWRAPASTCWCR